MPPRPGTPSDSSPAEPTIVDARDASRYEARVDGEIAGWVDYRRLRGRIAAIHTEVLPAFAGRGIARRLVRRVIDDARAEGIGVTPICPLFVAHFERHPEEADIVRTGRERRDPSDATSDEEAR